MRILLFGSTGTIGQATCKALLERGHEVVCFVRQSYHAKTPVMPAGAVLRFGDVQSIESVENVGLQGERFDAIVSCMASRTGTPRDAWAVDYTAHSQLLKVAQQAGMAQFVLLSAMCVQKPLLAFQQAKLAFEKELIESGLIYSIVRPTAFSNRCRGKSSASNKTNLSCCLQTAN